MWGKRASGSGRALSGAIGPEGGFRIDGGLQFDQPVTPGGYLWWYVDALSADGAHGLTIIIFVGSVFSPYYKWQRRNHAPDAENHCAVNVVLFGKSGKRWAMTERGVSSLRREEAFYQLGASRAEVTDDGMLIHVDETCVPLPFSLRGTVRVRFDAVNHTAFHLDSQKRHVWRPIAPCASVDVQFTSPQQNWTGRAYVDSNWGTEPVEDRFDGWQWSRADHRDATCVYYDVIEKDGASRSIACAFGRDGNVASLPPAALHHASKTGWRMIRPYRSEAGEHGLIETVEDTPFYARSLMAQIIAGERVTAIHESLSATRFASPAVQMMLPWRMPRWNKAPAL